MNIPTDDKNLTKDIGMAWEEFRGTKDGERVVKLGFFTTVAIHFCKFYIKRKQIQDGDKLKKISEK